MNITVNDNSGAVLAALMTQLEAGLADIGEQAVQHAQKELDRAKRNDTGELRGSIEFQVREDGVYIGTDNDHAAFHELGTGRYTKPHASEKYGVSAVHFLHHAASQHADEYLKILERAMKG